MNKIIKSSIIVMIVLSFIMSITSCAKRQEAYSPLYPHPDLPSEEIQQQILDCYNNSHEVTFSKFDFFKYYGEFNGCHVLMTEGMTQALHSIIVADYEFFRTRGFSIIAYKDDTIKDIREAYDDGWLTLESIAYLADYHKYSGVPSFDRVFPMELPANIKPGKLEKAAQAEFDIIFTDTQKLTPKDVKHYGNYDGIVVFFVKYGKNEPTEYTANNGETFKYNNDFSFILYDIDNALFITSCLPSSFDKYLSDDAITAIAKYHRSLNK